MTGRMLENRIRKLAALDAQAKALTAQADAIKAEIKAALTESPDFGPRYEYEAHGVTLTWNTVEKRVFDGRAFAKDHGRLYEDYKKTVTERPFRWVLKEVRA